MYLNLVMLLSNNMSTRNRGFSLVEVIVAAAVILVALLGIVAAFNSFIKLARSNSNAVEAAYLAEEGVQAVKSIRDASWATNISPLSLNTNYFLTYTSHTWGLNTTNTFIDSTFERKVVFASASRNSNGDIDPSGANDAGTKLITVSVSWLDHGATTTKSISTYITNYHND